MDVEVLTVNDLNNKIRKNIEGKFINLRVKGEISKPTLSMNGHYYFDLKDKNSKINCVLYKNYALKNKIPKEGKEVIVKGKVTVYKKNGTYNIQVIKIQESGIGNLYLEYQQLKEKLQKEGLFHNKYKKPIPKVPKSIGVITAPTGAVIHDIETTIKQKWPFTEIILFPSKVQGNDAANNLIKQLKKADSYELDTIIICRGGGSIEDLWCFNDETLARNVFNAKTPIISAVGHESDFTIIDDVADKRAATPTAAAEIAVPDISEKLNKLESLEKRLKQNLEYKLNECRQDFDHISNNKYLNNPQSLYEEKLNEFKELKNKFNYLSENLKNIKRTELENIKNKLKYNSKSIIKLKQTEFKQIQKKLEYESNNLIKKSKNQIESVKNSYILKNPQKIIDIKKQEINNNREKLILLNPKKTLKRGYTLTKKNNKIILSSKNLKKGDKIEIEFEDGFINAKVM